MDGRLARRTEGRSLGCAKSRRLMRLTLEAVLAMVVPMSTPAESAHGQGGAVPLATYVDVVPNAVDAATALLERYRYASRQQRGNLRFDVLHEIARPNRFAIVEAWTDEAALDGHDKAASTSQFRDQLKAIQSAPCDERVARALYTGRGKSGTRADTIYVLTHVDVTPDREEDGLALLRAMSIDAAQDYGNISYEVLQQANRVNHFTVVEEWANKKALDAHAQAAHTRAFRERLLPMQGALYDERFYKSLG
jgi:quinol monooxygenase YgiN